MPASIECPSCKRVYTTSAKRSGRTTNCWCGTPLTFPLHDESEGAVAPIGASTTAPSQAPAEEDLSEFPETPTRQHSIAPSANGLKNLIIGGVLIALGVGITVATYNQAHQYGGRYYIVYGPVIVGVIKCLRGLGQLATGD